MKERLREILLAKSVVRGREFKLASGKTSDFYVDARVTTLDAEGATLCGRIFFEMLSAFPVDAVGGYSIGADPIVAAIAVHQLPGKAAAAGLHHPQGRERPTARAR